MVAASKLAACALLVLASASDNSVSAQSLPCRTEASDTEPNPCAVLSDDCCPGYECLPSPNDTKLHSCQPEATSDAAVSHLMLDNASKFADALTSSMDKASAQLAAADKELKAAAAKTKVQASDGLGAVTADAQDAAQKADAMMKKASVSGADMSNKAKDALRSAVKAAVEKADLAKKKADELLKQATEKVRQADKKASKAMQQQKDKQSASTSPAMTNSASAAGGMAGGMGADFSKYIPGSTSGAPETTSEKDSKHGKKNKKKNKDKKESTSSGGSPSAGAGMAGGMGGGFDWKHFVPGGGPATKNVAMSAKEPSSPSASSGPFDWKKYQPTSVSNAAAVEAQAETPASSVESAQPTEGEKGGPCGKTKFKAFKKCVAGLKCQPAPEMALGWAPGTCVEAKLVTDRVESFAMSPPEAQAAPPAEGTAGGACGQTSFKQFKACDAGLVCAQPPKESMGFAPGKCMRDIQYAGAGGQPADGSPPQPGASGGPCGKTVYKDFGSCDVSLACIPAKPANVYAPGTCKPTTDPTDEPAQHSSAATNSAAAGAAIGASFGFVMPGQQVPGAAGGPCGQTTFFDFGPCHAGLDCMPGTQGSFGPGKCAEAGSSDANNATAVDVVAAPAVDSAAADSSGIPSFGGMDGGFDVSKFDQMPAAFKSTVAMFAATPTQGIQQPMSIELAIEQAKASAAHAQDMALKASEAADFLSAQLKAAADKLNEAAAKMKAKAEALEKQEQEAAKQKNATDASAGAVAVDAGLGGSAGVSVNAAEKEASIGANATVNEGGNGMKWFLGLGVSSLFAGMIVLFKHQSNKASDYEPIRSADVEL